MINKKYLKLLRSQSRFDANNFIYELTSKRIIDSLDLLKIKFDKILEVGINENHIYNYIKKKFNNININRVDIDPFKYSESKILEIDLDNLVFEKDHYSLVYSNFFIYLANDFEKSLTSILRSLKSNGFFIATIPHKESMYQLSNSMYEADLHLYKGVYKRANSVVDINEILPIFKKLNYDSPTVFTDTILIDYKKFEKLLSDVKKMNLSYIHNDKKKSLESKNYFEVLKKIYKEKYYNNHSYALEIKVNTISGWKK